MSTSRRTTGLVPLVASATPEKSAEALKAKRGAASDQPTLRADAVVRRRVQMGEERWFVKNPATFKYYVFYEWEWRLIELFDGTRSRIAIAEDYNARYPFDPIEISVVIDYEEMLRRIDLIGESTAERNLGLLARLRTARLRAAEEKAEGFNPFFMLFHVLNPNRFLNRTARYVRWVWTPPIVALWAVAVTWTVFVFALHFQDLSTGTYELYAFYRKPLLDAVHFFFILSFIGFFHEFGHAYAVKIYGGEVRDIGIALLYFTPAFYCDTTDALLFENKWQRLWVNTAGIYVEGFVCAAATALWVASYPDTFVHEISYKTMLFTGISTVFFNINPLIKIDGYYAMTSVLEMPDLREDAFRHIGAVFQKSVLRLPVEVPPASRRRRRIYWIYGLLALAYTAVIMRFIGGLFFNLYARYFPDVAVILLLLTLYRVFRKRVRLVTRTARLFYLDKKELLMSPHSRLPLSLCLVVLTAILFIPWMRRTVSAEATLSPSAVARVEAPENATVSQVEVLEGDRVKMGGLLVRLESAPVGADAARALGERDRFASAARVASAASAAQSVYANERSKGAAEVAVLAGEFRRERLLVRSPISGVILTPRIQDLEHRLVTAGTLLAEIGDCRNLVAQLPVSERLLDGIQVGAKVRGLSPQRPLHPLRGTIVRLASATVDQPRTVAGLVEPPAPAAAPDRFIVLAAFENADGALRPGDLVRAKIYLAHESLATRAWRVIFRWVRTIIW